MPLCVLNISEYFLALKPFLFPQQPALAFKFGYVTRVSKNLNYLPKVVLLENVAVGACLPSSEICAVTFTTFRINHEPSHVEILEIAILYCLLKALFWFILVTCFLPNELIFFFF